MCCAFRDAFLLTVAVQSAQPFYSDQQGEFSFIPLIIFQGVLSVACLFHASMLILHFTYLVQLFCIDFFRYFLCNTSDSNTSKPGGYGE